MGFTHYFIFWLLLFCCCLFQISLVLANAGTSSWIVIGCMSSCSAPWKSNSKTLYISTHGISNIHHSDQTEKMQPKWCSYLSVTIICYHIRWKVIKLRWALFHLAHTQLTCDRSITLLTFQHATKAVHICIWCIIR